MLGAVAGDIIGSAYERFPIKTKDFPLFSPSSTFTDDSVLTAAIAEAILTGRSYRRCLQDIGRRYPHAGYGGTFIRWLLSDNPRPYNSWGNGSAMRVSPVGFAFSDEATVLREAEKTAAVTHNHSEGIKGAQATALAIWMARTGHLKDDIRKRISTDFSYDLNRSPAGIRPTYTFDISCQGTIPEAIICFLDSTSYEDAVRNAVSLGGDSDTLACITGGIAEAFYGPIPEPIQATVRHILPPDLLEITDRFYSKFMHHERYADQHLSTASLHDFP